MQERENEFRGEQERPRETPQERRAPDAPERAPAERMEAGEARVRAEAKDEVRETKERAADLFWAGPKHFVETAVAAPFGKFVKRFLGYFGKLDEVAMASEALKKTREAAARAADDGEDVRQG